MRAGWGHREYVTALIFASLFFLSTHGQAEEHYIYKDPQGGLVISNQKPPAGSTILRKLDLPNFAKLKSNRSRRAAARGQPASWKPPQTGAKEIKFGVSLSQ